MAGQMKVGLIGESVTMHYLDYYCEKHKDRIAGFSDVRDDKKYQEDDIDFIVYRKDGSSFTVEAKADTYKTGNVFLETAVNSFAIGEDDKLLRFGKYQKAIAKHSKGWLYKEADYIFYYFTETRQIYVFERMAAMHYLNFALCSDTVFVHDERRPFGRAAENKEQRSNYMQYYGTGFCVNAEQMRRSDVIDHRMHRIWYPIRVAAHKDSLLAASGGNTGIELPVANVFSLGSLAQSAEHRTVNPSVAGSNPVRPATRSIAKVAYQPHTLAVAGSSPVSAPIVHAMTLNRLFMSIGRT